MDSRVYSNGFSLVFQWIPADTPMDYCGNSNGFLWRSRGSPRVSQWSPIMGPWSPIESNGAQWSPINGIQCSPMESNGAQFGPMTESKNVVHGSPVEPTGVKQISTRSLATTITFPTALTTVTTTAVTSTTTNGTIGTPGQKILILFVTMVTTACCRSPRPRFPSPMDSNWTNVSQPFLFEANAGRRCFY